MSITSCSIQSNKCLVVSGHDVDLESAEELYQKRITRIITTDFPHYFAVVTRVRQESNTVGPDGGMIASTVISQVQAVFPEGALTKNIKVGLQVTYVCLFGLLNRALALLRRMRRF